MGKQRTKAQFPHGLYACYRAQQSQLRGMHITNAYAFANRTKWLDSYSTLRLQAASATSLFQHRQASSAALYRHS